MAVEETVQPARPASKRPVKNTLIAAGVLVIVAYLAGFLPSYVKGNRLENDLRLAGQQNRMAQLRDLAGLAYFEASQKNYGLAAGTTARFFERTREVADQTADSSGKTALKDLLSGRDKIASELAKGDQAVLNDLQILYVKTRQATAISSGAPPPIN
jgi:hypothetical protein